MLPAAGCDPEAVDQNDGVRRGRSGTHRSPFRSVEIGGAPARPDSGWVCDMNDGTRYPARGLAYVASCTRRAPPCRVPAKLRRSRPGVAPGKPRVCCLWPAAPRAGFRPMGTTPGRRRSRRRRPRFCVAVLPTSGSRRAARSRARPRRGGPSGTRWAGARRGRGSARPRGAARRASGRGSGRPAPR